MGLWKMVSPYRITPDYMFAGSWSMTGFRKKHRWWMRSSCRFYLTDVVQSVDPVKLYEYIFLDKPIVCVRYPEIERFAPYVEFYETKDQFNAAIQRLLTTGSQSIHGRQADIFLEKNTWFVRGKCAAERMGLITTEE